jgi:hypothetical protein
MADLAYIHITELSRGEALKYATGALQYDCASLKSWKVIFLALMPKIILRIARDLKAKKKS